MKIKTLLSYTIVTILALLFTIGTASAAITNNGDCSADGSKVKYAFDSDGTLTIKGTGDMKSYGTSSSTQPWKSYREDIKKVVIESGVVRISSKAFDGLVNLTSVEISDTVKYIDGFAFYGCTSLTSITIPPNVTEIYDSFYGCSALYDINITDSTRYIDRYAFAQTAYSKDESNWENDVLYLGNFAMDCKNSDITEVSIRPGTTVIAKNAFNYKLELTKVTLPDSLKHIGHNAFSQCSALTEVNLPQGVYIGQNAFRYCTSLTEIVIPDYAEVDDCAFEYCSNVTKISLPDTIQGIDYYSFFGTPYQDDPTNKVGNMIYIDNVLIGGGATDGLVDIREGTVAIASRAFNNVSGIRTVSIPDSVHYVGDSAFARTGLKEAIIPDSVTYLGSDAFGGCTSLTQITLSKNIDSLGMYTFQNCVLLTEITIPDSVQSIGMKAFGGCSVLAKVTMGNGVKTVASDAFLECSKLAGVYINDLKAWAETDFANTKANPVFYSKKLYLNNSLITDLVIPDGVKRIGIYSFTYNTSLVSVTIPDSVEVVDSYAFYCCSALKEVNLGRGVKAVNYYGFCDCSKVNKVNVKDIVAYAAIDFDGSFASPVSYAKTLYINGNEISSTLTLPEGTTKIGSYTFYKCYPLNSVYIPKSVTSIGANAFTNNTYLEKIRYCGTNKSWAKETGGNTVIPSTTTLEYVCTETKRSGNTFTVTPSGVEIGHTITLNFYKLGRLVDVYTTICNGEDITYTPSGIFDEASVLVLDSISSLEPQHIKERI